MTLSIYAAVLRTTLSSSITVDTVHMYVGNAVLGGSVTAKFVPDARTCSSPVVDLVSCAEAIEEVHLTAVCVVLRRRVDLPPHTSVCLCCRRAFQTTPSASVRSQWSCCDQASSVALPSGCARTMARSSARWTPGVALLLLLLLFLLISP